MKNAEAIEYIKKNCYGEWCEDDWREAMDMAIEALKCSETPKSSEQNAETAQADHIADTGRKVEQTAEIAQNVKDEDLISRKSTIESIRECAETAHDNHEWDMEQGYLNAIECVEEEPSAQPTLHGYNIEHLELIARVLQKEDLPPERVVEALTDIGRIVAIVRDEFEETLRRAVDQCVT